jgi:hypothetical protein
VATEALSAAACHAWVVGFISNVVSLWGKFGGLHACRATFPYIVPLPNIFITRLFSKLRLKRKDFQEILRLPWAQEVPSSNLGAPTKNISRVFFYLLKAPFTSNPICGILSEKLPQIPILRTWYPNLRKVIFPQQPE